MGFLRFLGFVGFLQFLGFVGFLRFMGFASCGYKFLGFLGLKFLDLGPK